MSLPWLYAPALAALAALLAGVSAWRIVRGRNMHYWLGAHLRNRLSRLGHAKPAVRHVYFCFADHFEPYGATRDMPRARERVAAWLGEYEKLALGHRDSDGNHPRHSFFYPAEEYDAELVDQLAVASRKGLGDVEVHLHHDNDTAENLRATLQSFVSTLQYRHGLLRVDPDTGRPAWCFIHGNWALDNSRPDGRWCGVDNELDVLLESGCVADLTMPSAPSDTQTRKINSLYFARGHAGKCKSHDAGRDAQVGAWAHPGELLMIQGPLTLNWREAKFGILPRIESSELSFDAPPTSHRVALWGRCGVSVKGAEEHVFIKVHAHGATDRSMEMLFGGGFETLWSELERQYRDREGCQLHYVTAWDLYAKLKELTAGHPSAIGSGPS